jgi:hypothetical protein
MSTATNGHHPATQPEVDDLAARVTELAHASDEFFDSVRGQFATQIERELNIQAELTTLLDASRKRSRAMSKALDSLDGGPAAKPKPKSSKNGHEWTVSEAKIQEVVNIMRGTGEPMTAASLGKHDGLSPESARRALLHLRDREVVRFVRKGRGGGDLFALMPDAEV